MRSVWEGRRKEENGGDDDFRAEAATTKPDLNQVIPLPLFVAHPIFSYSLDQTDFLKVLLRPRVSSRGESQCGPVMLKRCARSVKLGTASERTQIVDLALFFWLLGPSCFIARVGGSQMKTQFPLLVSLSEQLPVPGKAMNSHSTSGAPK